MDSSYHVFYCGNVGPTVSQNSEGGNNSSIWEGYA